MHPPKATDPHAFPFCARCGAYRHQGPCPQPAPLPPPPSSLRSLTPLSAALASQPSRTPRALQPPPPSLPSALTECHYCKQCVWARHAGSDLRCPNGEHLTHLRSAARITLAVLIFFLALGTLGYFFNAGP